jgi:hypothetical protein
MNIYAWMKEERRMFKKESGKIGMNKDGAALMGDFMVSFPPGRHNRRIVPEGPKYYATGEYNHPRRAGAAPRPGGDWIGDD